MAELVVGADGGNSKTDLVLADTDGHVRARVKGGGTRAFADGMDVTMANMAGLVTRALSEAGIAASTPISSAVYFMANIDTPDEEDEAMQAIVGHALSAKTVVHNDTFAVLHAGAPEGWGVAVVCGAGINATGVHPDGRIGRFMSLGAISGDWGGGVDVGVAGLGGAVRAGDGRGPATVLRDLVGGPFALGSPEELARAIVAGDVVHADLGVLAPIVFTAAQDGDRVALGIVDRLADEITTMVRALLERLDLTHDATPIVLGGRTVQLAPPVLLDRITRGIDAIAPNAQPRLLDVPPVAGAVMHALSLSGADEAVRRAARDELREPTFSSLATAATGREPD